MAQAELPSDVWLCILELLVPNLGRDNIRHHFHPISAHLKTPKAETQQLISLLRVCRLFRAFTLPRIFRTIRLDGSEYIDVGLLTPQRKPPSSRNFMLAIMDCDEHALAIARLVQYCIFDSWRPWPHVTYYLPPEQTFHSYIQALPAFIHLKHIFFRTVPLSNHDVAELLAKIAELETVVLHQSSHQKLRVPTNHTSVTACKPITSLQLKSTLREAVSILLHAPFVARSSQSLQVLEIGLDNEPASTSFYGDLCQALPLFTSLTTLTFFRGPRNVIRGEVPLQPLPRILLSNLHTLQCPIEWAGSITSLNPLVRLKLTKYWVGSIDFASTLGALSATKDSLHCLSIPWDLAEADWSLIDRFPNLFTLQILRGFKGIIHSEVEETLQELRDSRFMKTQREKSSSVFPNLHHFEMDIYAVIAALELDLYQWDPNSMERPTVDMLTSVWPKLESVQLCQGCEWRRTAFSADPAQDWTRIREIRC